MGEYAGRVMGEYAGRVTSEYAGRVTGEYAGRVTGEYAGKLSRSFLLLQLVLENTSHSKTDRGIPCAIRNMLPSKVKRKEK
jgi:hypothetical protein